MPLKKPNQEDQRKLHAEINQINQQRLILSTLALTVFGLVIAWMLPKQYPISIKRIGGFEYSVSVLLSWLLFALFVLSYTLRTMLRVASLYLIETGASGWEADIADFRKEHGYVGHTKPQAALFISLILAAAAFPFLLAWIYSAEVGPGIGLWACLGSGAVTIMLIYLMGFHGLFEPDKRIADRWRILNQRK
jgi:hypothetical protein